MVTRLVSPAPLTLKLARDVWRLRGQALAIILVAMCGIATFVMMRGSYEALLASQAAYYQRYRFADVFASVKRAPTGLLERIRAIPGVNEADGRVVFDASLDVPGLEEPASARLVSLPERPDTGLNRIHVRQGRWPLSGNRDEVLVSEAFAGANALRPGDALRVVLNGRKQNLRIAGIAISPEFINEIKGPGFPDNRRFGILWMERESLAGASGMSEAFNDLAVTLAPQADALHVIQQLDILLDRYGSLGAYAREEQLSHQFLDNELEQTRITGTFIPAIFLGVAAFLIHNVLQRMSMLQRAQIGLLKSFGYPGRTVAWHYLQFALLTVLMGGALGIALGTWAGRGLAGLYATFYHFPRLEFSLSGFAAVGALLIAVASALAGALLAVARILSLPPAEAMRPPAPQRFRPGPLERLGLQRFMPLALRVILRNLERNPGKSLLSVLGLALAVALMITGQFAFDALDEIIRIQFRTAQRDDVTVTFNEVRDLSARYSLAALPGVLRVEPFRSVPVRMRFGHRMKKTAILGLEPDSELRVVLDERARPVRLPHDGIVLTRTLAAMLGVRAGDPLTIAFLEGRRNIVSLPVYRIVDEPVGLSAYMDSAALSRLAGTGELASGAFLAIDPRHQDSLYRSFKEIPALSSVSLREATLESFLATVGENMRINTLVLVVFSCVIAAGVVYNSARIALSEHAVELASLRILGLTKGEVGVMLLGEQALLVLPALPLGCLIGYGMSALLSQALNQELFRIPLAVSMRTMLSSVGVLIAASVASGYLVWRKIQRLDLIEVLKTRE